VLLCTGLRVGDAARVGRQHVKNGVVRLKTEKTRTPVALRVLPRLEHALAAGPKGFDTELVWITGKNRKAMQKGYLGDFLGNAAKKIGLDRSAHGLRKSAARRYIEAGARPRAAQGDLWLDDIRNGRQVHEDVQSREGVAPGDGRLRSRRRICPHPRFRWGNEPKNKQENKGLENDP
jgi:integrase